MRAWRFGILLFSVLFIWGCRDHRAIRNQAEQLWREGEKDQALEILMKANERYPDQPVIMAELGRLLSLQRFTVFSGLELMEKSLEMSPDEQLRSDLLSLYLDLDMIDQAREFLGPNRIPVEDFFLPDMIVMRAGVHCIYNPEKETLRQLGSNNSKLVPLFMARCLSSQGWGRSMKNEINSLVENTRDEKSVCEILSVIPSSMYADPNGWKLRIMKCRAKYPENLVIQRERPLRDPAMKMDGPRVLFHDTEEIPPDPGQKSIYHGPEMLFNGEYQPPQ